MGGSKRQADDTKCKFTEEPDPWKHPANNQPQEPYHLPGKGVMDINPTPPWRQPVQRFSVDQTLLTHAKPEGYPALTAVPLRDLPGYLWRVKWTHVLLMLLIGILLNTEQGMDLMENLVVEVVPLDLLFTILLQFLVLDIYSM